MRANPKSNTDKQRDINREDGEREREGPPNDKGYLISPANEIHGFDKDLMFLYDYLP